MHSSLIDFKNEVIERLTTFQADRDFDELVTALISDANDLSDSRIEDATAIVTRMFNRLNEGRTEPLDTRPTSEAYDTMRPIAMSIRNLGQLVSILRAQVHVYTATGTNLDDLGRDYDFPRFEATQARRRGETYNNREELHDFPPGSRFLAPNTPLAFLVESTESGNVIFICEQYGTAGNTFFGDLVGINVNGLGRAIITDEHGAYIPGQDRETDEQYRRRFLQFLRRKAFGGNVSQYQQEVQAIDGVGQLMVFPCWRNAWTVKVSIVDGENTPASDDFIGIVQDLVDPILRGGTGYGFAPVGHRVTISTPQYLDIDIVIPVVPAPGATIGMIQPVAEEITEVYFAELTQAVFDTWERTYFANDGIGISVVELTETIGNLNDFITLNEPAFTGDIIAARNDMLAVLEWFPAEHQKQSHTFTVLLQPQILGTRILTHELISAVDFENIRINGEAWLRGFPITSTEEAQFLPRLRSLTIIEVSDGYSG